VLLLRALGLHNGSRLPSCLGTERLPRGLATGGLSGCLLRTSHEQNE
jgi:hypothetical protein